jgi:hypothetical protein
VKKRKVVEATVPARIEELGFGCPHVVVQLQKSVGDVWPRISSANALQKERSGPSERGPSSERVSAGETVGERVEQRGSSRVGLTALTGEDRRKTQGDERSPFTVAASPRAVMRSRDRGCNGHRILRRVPIDGRHPGSSRGVSFHEKASTVILAIVTSSDPYAPTKRRTYGQMAAPAKVGEARG